MDARRFAFYAIVVAFVGLFGAITWSDLVVLFTGWFVGPETDLGPHRIHELAIAATLWAILLGMLAQVRRPETAVPLLLFAGNQIALQAGTADIADHDEHAGAEVDHEEVHQEHVDEGHFASAAGYVIAIVLLGLLASLLPLGWWLSAWSAGAMAIVYGLASVLFPDLASSVGTLWGGLAVLWGVAFVVTAEVTGDEATSSPLSQRLTGRSTGATSE